MEVEDLVMIQLSQGAGYIPIEGAALKERLASDGGVRPFKVRTYPYKLVCACLSLWSKYVCWEEDAIQNVSCKTSTPITRR